MLRKLGWFLTGFFCIGVAIYAFFYFFATEKVGLLLSKPAELFQNSIWYAGFYAHVGFGGLALMVGWTQFSKKLRARYMKLHRLIGKFYVITCLLIYATSMRAHVFHMFLCIFVRVRIYFVNTTKHHCRSGT